MNSSPRLARRLVDERRIPVYKVGRFVRIAESDLLEFIQNGSRSARA
ncbi:MAG: helix-turn-helix domain-containing protein [Actinobacteria bacterium]|nr:helix-turn-helix domain-containing protein [Actinomycetota bacterium]